MLRLFDSAKNYQRREFLRIGGLGLAGMTLPAYLEAKASSGGSFVRDKSVIFLFLHGGPSQIETFDPKMTAPAEIRSVTGEVSTALPGVTFGGTFTKLAQRANQLAVVRSFTTGDAKHDIKPIVSATSLNANLGAIYSRLVGANHATTGMPTNCALFPQAVDASTQPGQMKFGKFTATGELGAAYAPFVPGAGGNLQQDMQLKLPMNRLDDRRSLLAGLDRLKWMAETSAGAEGTDHFRQQAFNTILGGVADAFDLSKEDPRLIAQYDTAPLVRPNQISRRWNNYNNYVDNAKSLGKLLLLARRLCEAGCGFVTVTTNFVWDMHADRNNAGVEEGMGYMGVPLDHAVSAFLDDIQSRGLGQKILLVVCGEMGRTPKINKNSGRDHWGNSAPLLLAGGGLRMGQVIGQSTRDAGEPQTEPYGLAHLSTTIMHTLFDAGQFRVERGIPSDVAQLVNNHAPIAELFT